MFDIKKILSRQHRKMILDALLTPFSWVYGAVVWVRNLLYDSNLLKSKSYDDVPVVSVGNITVGGTGKTPHVEYIIEALHRQYHIGVLSRGYKRATSGFIMATDSLSPRDIGDEPFQIFHKYNGLISLAVCEDRRKGIEEMRRIDPAINLILLDDGFQHRRVKPKVNILLVDYTRQPDTDHLLPRGSLREPKYRLLKADIVVVSKCPANLSPVDIRTVKLHLGLFPFQQLYFSTIKYANPVPVFPVPQPQLTDLSMLSDDDTLLCVTGIANPRPLWRYLNHFKASVKVYHFEDHHFFSRRDFQDIFRLFDELSGRRRFIVTTEKDSVRILGNAYYPADRRDVIFYIPIRVGFADIDGREFIPELINKIKATEIGQAIGHNAPGANFIQTPNNHNITN